MAMDYAALAEFRYEIRRFLNFSEQAARKAGIEAQQHQALLAIKGFFNGGNATVGALAEKMQIQHHSAVELSNRLEANRLISRRRDGADRRQVHLRLALRGEKLLRDLSAAHREELRSTGPRLIAALIGAVHGNIPNESVYKVAPFRKARRVPSKKTRKTAS
jgi:DNA-binding MarR family transcriptional regulator